MTQPALDQIAPLSRRAVAYVIDALIAGGLAIVLGGGLLVAASLTGSVEGMVGVLLVGGPVVSLVLLGWFVVYTVMQAGAGSIGMRAQGVQLVAAADGGPLGFGRALLRNVIFGLAAAVVVGYFTPLFDGSGRFQGWHDKVAGSLILDARKTGPVRSASEATSSSSASAPGLATPTTGPAIPGLPQSVPAASAASAAPAAPTPAAPAPAAPASSSLPPRPAAPPAPVAESGSLIAFVPGITQDAPSRSEPPAQLEPELDATVQQHPVAPVTPPVPPAPPAPVAAPPVAAPPVPPLPVAPAPAAPEVVEQDDDLEETRISVPGHRLVFTWDDGTRVSVSRRTIFGRNPAPEEGATLVPVRDETLSLSKTHFEAAAETSGGWVRDRHSTNGMTIVRDGQRIACPAGQRVPVRLGDAIEIGDRIVTIGGYA
ncbi:hypothetical protein FGL91_07305 [Microbacterium sp. CBA3102]|uniref:RDD family protein n=1 Tax=Microbacterium sp. CBA3102 TaxID=2603598 RepID=UPI0011BB3AE4|nr:RDD family protein [Microbacterium sp. CBA3102]QEA28385.1 hypothetical protein FGL91_07305 [Microbacterium sp. CBA3102]